MDQQASPRGPSSPERLAAKWAIKVALRQVNAGGRPAVPPGEGPQGLQAAGHCCCKALFTTQVGGHQLVDGTSHLQSGEI